MLSVLLGAANLILAVIVESSVQAREADSQAVIMKKRNEKMEFANKLRHVLRQADADSSGTLTLDELVHAYERDSTLREAFNLMDIDRDDLRSLYGLLGADEHIGLSYSELVDLLQKAKLQDMRVYLMTMRLQMEQVAAIAKMTHELCTDMSGTRIGQSLQCSGASVTAARAAPKQAAHNVTLHKGSMAGQLASASSVSQEHLLSMVAPDAPPAIAATRCKSHSSDEVLEPSSEVAQFDVVLQQLRLRLDALVTTMVHDAVNSVATLARQPACSAEHFVPATTYCTEPGMNTAKLLTDSPQQHQLPHLLPSARRLPQEIAVESARGDWPKSQHLNKLSEGKEALSTGHVPARVAQRLSSRLASNPPSSCDASSLV